MWFLIKERHPLMLTEAMTLFLLAIFVNSSHGKWKTIQDEIRAGGDVSHILNVKVANKKDRGVVRRIKAAIFKRIANKPITRFIEGYKVTLKWKTKGRPPSACYFCDS
jgi:hypothetical protein